ncbi:MAG: 16S rRNA (uracil(1498)-N(3))-methyltransferase [Chromatiales bacterium 21-64-14]|nr:MAG: 16S rRNA (uracil(1498)-N(3))-methyltransferase [Chromatiales bacterium 21-64-14]HQU15787.1 16S rRNA (uracil(1498)-N(3))-methyltransferase [Gammaproteobacteria bacterium]
MRVPRLYVPQPLAPGLSVELDPSAARHTTRVLRLRPGAELILFNGDGSEYHAELTGDPKRGGCARIIAAVERHNESPLAITLGQGIARGERMDYIVQKAVELGVACIVPLITERTVVRLEGARREQRRSHWQRIVESACEQCGRTRLPQLLDPMPLDQWIPEVPAGNRWYLDPDAPAGFAQLPRPVDGVVLVIGPEGGFSPDEKDTVRKAGFRGTRMGPRILRTETATLAALAALQTLWGDAG